MAIIGIGIGFSAILFLSFKKVNLGVGFFVGTVVAGLASGLGVGQVFQNILLGIFSKDSLQLMVTISLISGMGSLLKQTGDLEQIVNSLINLLNNNKLLTIIFPIVFGTLNVPGGAIFSAPLIEDSAERINLDPHQKTAVNVFFRHIALFIYPLFTCLIIASELANVDKYQIIKFNLLVFFVGFISFYYLIFKINPKLDKTQIKREVESGGKAKYIVTFLKGFSPVLIILLISFLINLPFYLSVVGGLLLGAGRRLPPDQKHKVFFGRLKDFLFKGINYNLTLLIMGVMAFKSMVEGSGAIDIITVLLSDFNFSLIIPIILLTSIVAMITGFYPAALGISIPIFLPMIPPESKVIYTSLIFDFAFLGYLLSPLHLCLALTKEYFAANWLPVYRYLFPPVVLMAIAAIIQAILLV